MNKVFKEKGIGEGMKVYTLFGKNPLSLLILLLLTLSALSTLNVNTTSVSASIPDSPYIAVVPDTIVDETLTSGENFTVSIYTDYNGSDVWGWQFTLSYNPTIIQGVNVTNGDLIHPDKSVYAMFEAGEFDNVAGKLSLTLAFFFFQPPTPPTTTSGPGTLANVTFTVVGIGTSDITLGPETQLKAPTYDIIDAVLDPYQIGHGFFANIPLPPVADANGPYSGYEGTPITFDATGSTDLDGTIDLYEWDWNNNGTYDESTASPTINHTWPDDRTGTVGLRVTDDDGQTHTDTASVTVNNVAPTVNAGPDRAASANQTVNFSGSFTDPGWLDTHTIFWDFGDGSNASGTLTPTHVYTEARAYTVTLNITDDDAGVGQDTLKITVSTVPVHDVAILSVTPNATKVIQGSAVNITVVAFNEGTETESFNITAYANTAEIGTEEVTGLATGTQTTLSFIWYTTGFSSGNYTIKAVASTVENETDTHDNTKVADDTVTVQNSPPTAPVVDVTPNAPVTSDNLTCTVKTPSSDPDGDTITYTYEWYRDQGTGFEPQPALTTVTTELSVTIDSSNTQKGDVWRCAVTPNDGTENGPSGQDDVTIGNSPPTANANGPYVSDEWSSITFDASGSSDPDEDTLQYRWDFNNDGAWDTEYSTDPTASYTWGDDYSGTVVVEVYDGGLTDTDTATVTVMRARSFPWVVFIAIVVVAIVAAAGVAVYILKIRKPRVA